MKLICQLEVVVFYITFHFTAYLVYYVDGQNISQALVGGSRGGALLSVFSIDLTINKCFYEEF